MFRLITAAALAASLAGCATQPAIPGSLPDGGKVAFTVNGYPVSQAMLDARLSRLPPQARAQIEQSGDMDQFNEEMAMSELLYHKAVEKDLHTQPDVQVAIAMAERGALASEFLQSIVDERTNDEAIQKWYDDHLVQFQQQEVKIRLIAAADATTAESVVAKARGGADFGELAKQYSLDPNTKDQGGDLGWMDKRALPPELARVVFAGGPGDVLGPVSTPNGQLVFKVEEKRDNQKPLSEVRDDVESRLQQEVVEAYIKELRAELKLEKDAAGAAPVAPAEGTPPAEAAPPTEEAGG